MAIVSCPNCGKAVSDLAAACPHCGSQLHGAQPQPQPQPQPYQQPVKPQAPTTAKPDSNLGLAIAGTILCWPFGIAAIHKAAKVDVLWAEGRYSEATSMSASARKSGMLALILGIVLYVVVFIGYIAMWDEIFGYNDYYDEYYYDDYYYDDYDYYY